MNGISVVSLILCHACQYANKSRLNLMDKQITGLGRLFLTPLALYDATKSCLMRPCVAPVDLKHPVRVSRSQRVRDMCIRNTILYGCGVRDMCIRNVI